MDLFGVQAKFFYSPQSAQRGYTATKVETDISP
jgi:hypothetical protein